jgi:heme exporter protein A
MSFRVEPRQILLVEGSNGSGKTSLLRILCGIRAQDDGQVLWCGEEIESLGPEYHEHTAYVGHTDGIKRDLTPRENLRVARALARPNEVEHTDQVLEQVDLYGFEDIPTRNLSAGQQRRLALARLLVVEARLWILDEPFTSLDRKGMQNFESIMTSHLCGGGMIVATSHHEIQLNGADTQRINLSNRPHGMS